MVRQNETQCFTYSIYTEQESENTASPEARDYQKLLSFVFTNKQALTQLVEKTMSMKRYYLKS